MEYSRPQLVTHPLVKMMASFCPQLEMYLIETPTPKHMEGFDRILLRCADSGCPVWMKAEIDYKRNPKTNEIDRTYGVIKPLIYPGLDPANASCVKTFISSRN